MNPNSLSEARQLVSGGDLSVFSFDIFDTFLVRKCTAPDGVYERTYQLATFLSDAGCTAESFMQNRMLAESRARARKSAKTGFPEVTIFEIYQMFPLATFGLPSDCRTRLAELEFQAELDLCFLNKDVCDIVLFAKKAGLKVGFISDTYWSTAQLSALIRNVAPDLEFDFIFPSCEFGVGKAGGLFTHYLAAERVFPSRAAHMGDNPVADIQAADKVGIKPVYYPQAPSALFSLFGQEAEVARLVMAEKPGAAKRLDGGLSVLRRLAVGNLPPSTQCHQFTGTAIIGPVLLAFQKFAERRVAEIQRDGRKAKVLFLARDGFLPFRIWQMQAGGEPADYVEISRRVTLVAASDSLSTLQELFRGAKQLDEAFLASFFKADLPSVRAYFDRQPDRLVKGSKLADDLPSLVSREEMAVLAQSARERLLDYLQGCVLGFDDCTDIILIDLGYSGTIQKSLRTLFDLAGIDKNIHGIYLVTHDHKFDLDERDSARGLFDDTVFSPNAKAVIQRNVALFEQICCAPVGSVRGYDGARVIREPDVRTSGQIDFCRSVQEACTDFIDFYARMSAALKIDPLQDIEGMRLRAAVIFYRFLALPSFPEERAFGALQHDINLGSSVAVPLSAGALVAFWSNAIDLNQALAFEEPPMWLAGSLLSVSPMVSHQYALSGFGSSTDSLADIQIGSLDATVVSGEDGVHLPAEATITPFGDIRIRIPVPPKYRGAKMVIPVAKLISHGAVRAVVLQLGENLRDAVHSRDMQSIPVEDLRAIGMPLDKGHFDTAGEEANLVLDIPDYQRKSAVMTILMTRLP